MKWLQSGIVIALVLLALVTVGGYFVTRDSSLPKTTAAEAQSALVDQRPLQTAQRLAPLAATPDEQKLARDAARLGDHAVDLAFADALMEAAEHPAEADPKNRQMYARLQKIQTTLNEELARLDQLKAQLSSAKVGSRDALQDRMSLLQAQADLDQDDLEDAKEDLIRAGGDPKGKIERLRAEHEAREHGENTPASQTSGPTPGPTVDLGANTLLQQVRDWRLLRQKTASLDAAQEESSAAALSLGAQHNTLERHVAEESAERENVRLQATGPSTTTANKTTGNVATANPQSSGDTLASLKHFANDQRELSDFDKRIQDEQDLASTYSKWNAIVAGERRSVLHGMLGSALWILLIVLLAFLGSNLIDGYFSGVAPERKRFFTLRAIIRFSVQAIGVLLIAFVIFGAPNQLSTFLGLAGAGLTVALKDFIVGFVGWFVLMGRNGIRVGDWVEINGVMGEVIEIGLLRTVLLETGNWTDTGHPTGRKVAFVNSYAIEGHFFNFSTAGQWLWDELQVEVGQAENPYPLVKEVQKLVEEETKASSAQAEQEWQKSLGYRKPLTASPAIHLRPTVTGVEMQVRYITSANERYATRSMLYEKIVGLLRAEGTASEAQPRDPKSVDFKSDDPKN